MQSRLAHTPISHWLAAGKIHDLQKRMKADRRQVSRNAACSLCKTKKIRCSGTRPCEQCQLAGKDCDLAAPGQSQDAVSLLLHDPIPRPVPIPPAPDFSSPMDRAMPDLTFGPACDYIMAELGDKFFLGREGMFSMYSNLASPLRCLFARLGSVLEKEMMRSTELLLPIPDLSEEAYDSWNAASMCYLRAKLSDLAKPASEAQSLHVNPAYLKMHGVCWEGFNANIRDVGLPSPISSEYRFLCSFLDFHLNLFRGRPAKSHVWLACYKQCNGGDIWGLVRETTSLFADGLTNTSCMLHPDEYDSYRAATAGSSFLECSRTGRELLASTEHIIEEERIGTMMKTEEGRAKLKRLELALQDAFLDTDR